MKVNGGGISAGIWAGFPEDNLREIKGMAKNAIAKGALKPASKADRQQIRKLLTQSTPPMKLVNVTPKGLAGVGYRALPVTVNGKVFVASQVVVPNAPLKWFQAGHIIH